MKHNRIKQRIRSIYQAKRRTKKWKQRKIHNKKQRLIRLRKSKYKKIINHQAPADFSFINNTSEIVEYFNVLTNHINNDQPLHINISKITNLSPDIIVLLIAKLKDKKSVQVGIIGNAPDDPYLQKMFVESGLYNFVRSRSKKTVSQNNKLWRHSTNNKVKGEIAGDAVTVCKDFFLKKGIVYDTDSLYNLLVEAMSNTINHATSNLNWWIYYFIDEEQEVIKYSFIDLGIGIFKSASFNSYRQFLNRVMPTNKLLVKPFLEGKIVSSRKQDNEISGKGIKQIISCAQRPEFTNFIIITNDQKINIKTKGSEDLNANFDGTFIYFEISYKKLKNNGSKV